MVNGEVQKYHGKNLFSAHLLLECFKTVFIFYYYGWSLLRPKWVSFLVGTLFCTTHDVSMSIFETVPVLHATVAPLKALIVTTCSPTSCLFNTRVLYAAVMPWTLATANPARQYYRSQLFPSCARSKSNL